MITAALSYYLPISIASQLSSLLVFALLVAGMENVPSRRVTVVNSVAMHVTDSHLPLWYVSDVYRFNFRMVCDTYLNTLFLIALKVMMLKREST